MARCQHASVSPQGGPSRAQHIDDASIPRVCRRVGWQAGQQQGAWGTAAGAWRRQQVHAAPGRSPSRLSASVTDEFPVDEWPVEARLIAAASAGDLPRLRAVLASHPNTIDARTSLPCSVASGYSALHFAAFNGHLACMRVLLAAGANVNTRDDRLATPLHWAAASAGFLSCDGGGEPCLQALIEAGADLDARDEDGETALHCAARLGNLAAIRCLAEAGAYLGAINVDGATPRILARNSCKYDAATLLGQLQADLDAAMEQAHGGGIKTASTQQTSAPVAAPRLPQAPRRREASSPALEDALASGLFGPELTGRFIRVWWSEREEFVLGQVMRCILPDRVHVVQFEGVDPGMRYQRLRLEHEYVEVQGPEGQWLRYSAGRRLPQRSECEDF